MKEEVRKMSGIKREKIGEKVRRKRGGVQVKMKKRKRGHEIKGCTDEGKRRSR